MTMFVNKDDIQVVPADGEPHKLLTATFFPTPFVAKTSWLLHCTVNGPRKDDNGVRLLLPGEAVIEWYRVFNDGRPDDVTSGQGLSYPGLKGKWVESTMTMIDADPALRGIYVAITVATGWPGLVVANRIVKMIAVKKAAG